jgi:hypothetical protein
MPPSKVPIDIFPTCSDQAIQFWWSTPASDGGYPILAYYLSCDSIPYSQPISPSTFVYTVGGLTNGTNYQFYIQAYNENDELSEPSYYRNVQPGNLPGPPATQSITQLTATTALAQMTQPVDNGGATVKWFVVSMYDQQTSTLALSKGALGTQTNLYLTGLTQPNYYYTLQAVNDPGYSPPIVYTYP